MKKRIITCILAGILTLTSLTGCSSFNANDVVVTVGEQKITAEVANFYARYIQAQYETYYSAYLGENMWSSEASEGETYEESVKAAVLKNLENMVLLEQHMSDYDVSLSDEEKQVIKDAAKEFGEKNPLEDKEKVSGSDQAVERVLTLMAVQMKMEEVIEAGADTEVADEEVAQKKMQYIFFSYTVEDDEGQPKDMTDKEKTKTKKKAEDFVKAVKEGKDFEAYAKEQELDVKDRTFNSDTMVPAEELIEAADKLKEGEITDMIETDKGCYVAKVTSLLDREATDEEKESVIEERKEKQYNDTCDELRKDVKIEVNDEVWDKISFKEVRVKMKEEEKDPYANDVKTDDVADAEEKDSKEDTDSEADKDSNENTESEEEAE